MKGKQDGQHKGRHLEDGVDAQRCRGSALLEAGWI